ncbi:MAG: DUF2892 domain-containing protein [Anaerolineae bacterium]|jgi:hypothetical protein|nr:DUF2892 domain-containing protein [Anaerolineae bacterium]MDH7473955.1 DUF2892 domain-containing protein [Anaerolineae bacterium]
MFQQNEGMIDRIVRAVLGLILLWAGLWPLGGLRAVVGIIVTLIGLILVFTALTGFCLIYRILGISTLRK